MGNLCCGICTEAKQFPGNDDRSSIRCILRIYHVQSE